MDRSPLVWFCLDPISDSVFWLGSVIHLAIVFSSSHNHIKITTKLEKIHTCDSPEG